uniref:Uncharacterized protein n=1 Tax=Romanomermis culicivorax TaxID=13658 RepID=A0A915IAH2_ROMCU
MMPALVAYGRFLNVLVYVSILFCSCSCRYWTQEKEQHRHGNQLFDRPTFRNEQKRGDLSMANDRLYRQQIIPILKILNQGYVSLLAPPNNTKKDHKMDDKELCNVYQALVDLSNKFRTKVESERSAIKSDKKITMFLGIFRNNMDRGMKILGPLLMTCRQKNPIFRELMGLQNRGKNRKYTLFPVFQIV